MGDVKFVVEAREGRGKGSARRLRQRGLVPGVVYGGGKEATSIAFDTDTFERLLETSHGGVNTLIDLEGDSAASGRTVIAKELQREPVRGALVHVDFHASGRIFVVRNRFPQEIVTLFRTVAAKCIAVGHLVYSHMHRLHNGPG